MASVDSCKYGRNSCCAGPRQGPDSCPLIVQVSETIIRYREILLANHSTVPYVIVLTKNLDPATVQSQLTLDCVDTDGELLGLVLHRLPHII